MAMKKYDFSGWATVNDMLCADGRTIRRDAFKDNDGRTVPLVWNHDHNSPNNVLGHALLENRRDGVYAYCFLNDGESANDARILLKHGDVNALSIYANHLKQVGGDVYHGEIKEVSLVLAGANPGALIEDVDLSHADEGDSEAKIFTDEVIELYHADDKEEPEDEEEDKKKKPEEEPEKPEEKPEEKAPEKEEPKPEEKPEESEESAEPEEEDKKKKEELEHSDTKQEGKEMAESGKTIGEIFDTLSEEQKEAVYAIVGQIADDKKGGSEEDEDMKHNIFDTDSREEENVLSHADMEAIMADGANYGSLKKAALAHGVEHIDYLFPDAQLIDKQPNVIDRDQSWVKKFMNATHHSPFSRIKTIDANITADEARAKGYIKGKLKKEEVIKLLRRTTEPTTVYKKQKLDRDDVIDITDFDIVAWLKLEMRGKLDEEIARAALIGDGRSSSDEDKINEEKVRPIATDADLYTIKAVVEAADSVDGTVKNFIRTAVKARKDYKGSGNPTLYSSNDMITDCLLTEDSIGRRLYNTEQELASALRVKEIVEVPVLENAKVTINGVKYSVLGVIVNPADYNIGADKGGAVSMFDDFDIDYNKQIYLIETRLSGALTKPYSAITLLKVDTSSSSDDEISG